MAVPVRREERTRVTFFLPVNNAREEQALMEVVRYLVAQRRGAAPVTGFTYSNLANGVFSGTWWTAPARRKGGWVGPENIILFIVDLGQKIDEVKLTAALTRLKRAIIRAYRKGGSPQDEVWLVAERVVRYA